jgi:hypothetical protein
MTGCPTLRKLDIGGAIIKTVGCIETIIMRTLAGSQIEHLMIDNHDAQAYVLFISGLGGFAIASHIHTEV